MSAKDARESEDSAPKAQGQGNGLPIALMTIFGLLALWTAIVLLGDDEESTDLEPVPPVASSESEREIEDAGPRRAPAEPVKIDSPAEIQDAPAPVAHADVAVDEIDRGPRVERLSSELHVRLLDARGEALVIPYELHCSNRLERRIASFSLSPFSLELEKSASRLRLDDPSGVGLEAGLYEVRASVGSYGLGKRSFTVSPGETEKTVELRMPGWRRVITLLYVDAENGQPLESILRAPRFKHQSSLSAYRHGQRPSRVLRDPPGNSGIGIGGGAGGGTSFRSSTSRGCLLTRQAATPLK